MANRPAYSGNIRETGIAFHVRIKVDGKYISRRFPFGEDKDSALSLAQRYVRNCRSLRIPSGATGHKYIRETTGVTKGTKYLYLRTDKPGLPVRARSIGRKPENNRGLASVRKSRRYQLVLKELVRYVESEGVFK